MDELLINERIINQQHYSNVGQLLCLFVLTQSEGSGFSEFHLYVCAAFLIKWSTQLQAMEFQVNQ